MPTETDDLSLRPSTENPIQLDEFRSRQERLRDTVEDIQKQLSEKKKPWYRQTSTLLSVASTLFAISSGIYSIQSAQKDSVNKSAADLQTIVGELLQLHAEENQDLSTAKNDFEAYSVRSSFRNTKRLSLLEQAAFKVKAASNQVSPSLLIVLATESDINGDYKTTSDYLTLAVQRSIPHSPEKVGSLFTLAQFCLTDGKALCPPGKGESYYKLALEEQPDDSDGMHYQRGQLLARIALLLHQTGAGDDEARAYLNQASLEEAAINPYNTLKQQLAQYLTTARANFVLLPSNKTSSFSTPEVFLGSWRIAYAKNPTLSGAIRFVQLPTSPFYGAYLDIFQDGRLLEKQSGQVITIDPKTLRLDWAGIAQTGQTAGYSMFHLAPAGAKITVEQYRLGELPVVASLQRQPLELHHNQLQ